MMSLAQARGRAGQKLSTLLAGLVAVDPGEERGIHGLSTDSRRTKPGDLFLACQGKHAHGQDFIAQAIAAGAVAVVREPTFSALDNVKQVRPLHIPMFDLAGLTQQVGHIAERFYHYPTRDIFVVGVTGTNGKTSVCHFLAQALSEGRSHFSPCGLIGTLGNGLYGDLEPGTHTTPEALSLHALLAYMRKQGARSVVMEASSHGLEQGRANGVAFDLALFTNLSRDHLDYHADMTAYASAKRGLFLTPGLRYAVINADDACGREILGSLPAGIQALSYGLKTPAPQGRVDVRGSNLELNTAGLEMTVTTPWGEGHLRSDLLGRFNASNLLAALAALLLMGMPIAEGLERLARTRSIPGRMECIGGSILAEPRALASVTHPLPPGRNSDSSEPRALVRGIECIGSEDGASQVPGQPMVVVDYAHTPDALEQVLRALRTHMRAQAGLWCVFGCGGERDRGKRPLMGAVAEDLADYIVLTDDNPRREEARDIVEDILKGMRHPKRAIIEHTRNEAIAFAIKSAGAYDVVLIAGKGHEEYQLMGGQSLPFSDRQQARAVLNEVR